ncbi:hypothetical protein CSUI_001378, partial [Cystoisospora suis]
ERKERRIFFLHFLRIREISQKRRCLYKVREERSRRNLLDRRE